MNFLNLLVKDILIIKVLLYSTRREIRKPLNDFSRLFRIVFFNFLLEKGSDSLTLINRHIRVRNLSGQALTLGKEGVMMIILLSAFGNRSVLMFFKVTTAVASLDILEFSASQVTSSSLFAFLSSQRIIRDRSLQLGSRCCCSLSHCLSLSLGRFFPMLSFEAWWSIPSTAWLTRQTGWGAHLLHFFLCLKDRVKGNQLHSETAQ